VYFAKHGVLVIREKRKSYTDSVNKASRSTGKKNASQQTLTLVPFMHVNFHGEATLVTMLLNGNHAIT